MFARIAAAAIFALFGIALIFTGVVYIAGAIDGALAGSVGAPGAAAITAVLLLIGPAIAALVLSQQPKKEPPPKRPLEDMAMTVLGSLLRNSSLYAVLGAGAIGLFEALLNRRKK